jgi:hypothetical protein
VFRSVSEDPDPDIRQSVVVATGYLPWTGLVELVRGLAISGRAARLRSAPDSRLWVSSEVVSVRIEPKSRVPKPTPASCWRGSVLEPGRRVGGGNRQTALPAKSIAGDQEVDYAGKPDGAKPGGGSYLSR